MLAILRWTRALLFGAHLFRHRFPNQIRSTSPGEQTVLERFIEKKRQQERLYKNKKFKKRPKFRVKNYKYQGTKSQDHRYSNQRSLRRMFRNS